MRDAPTCPPHCLLLPPCIPPTRAPGPPFASMGPSKRSMRIRGPFGQVLGVGCWLCPWRAPQLHPLSAPHWAFGACSEEWGAGVLALTRGSPLGSLGVSTPPLPLSTDRLQLLQRRRRSTRPSSGVVGDGRGRGDPARHPRPTWAPLAAADTLTHWGGVENDFLSLALRLGARREWATLPQASNPWGRGRLPQPRQLSPWQHGMGTFTSLGRITLGKSKAPLPDPPKKTQAQQPEKPPGR